MRTKTYTGTVIRKIRRRFADIKINKADLAKIIAELKISMDSIHAVKTSSENGNSYSSVKSLSFIWNDDDTEIIGIRVFRPSSLIRKGDKVSFRFTEWDNGEKNGYNVSVWNEKTETVEEILDELSELERRSGLEAGTLTQKVLAQQFGNKLDSIFGGRASQVPVTQEVSSSDELPE